MGFPGAQNSFQNRFQMADLLSATATITELLPASDKQLTTTAEQQTCTLYPQPYAPDKQGPADIYSSNVITRTVTK